MINFFKKFLPKTGQGSFKDNKKSNSGTEIETDIKKIIEEAALGNKKVITPTQILICVMHSVYDSRFNVENMFKCGLDCTKMTRTESISAALAFLILMAFDNEFSPKFVANFLDKYCVNSASEFFISYYKALAHNKNIDISKTLFDDDDVFFVVLDIAAYAKKQSSYDNVTFDMPFKEPYLSRWNNAFTRVE